MTNRDQILAILTISLALSACGGGSDDAPSAAVTPSQSNTITTAPEQSVDPAPQETVLAAETTLHDCFTLSPGAKFAFSNGYQWLIVEEPFQGQIASGSVELRKDGSRFGVRFSKIEGNDFRFLGHIDYSDRGVYSSTQMYYPSAVIPLTLKVGESYESGGVNTRLNAPRPHSPVPEITTERITSKITYLGREDLVLGGHKFADVCKFQSEFTSVGIEQPSDKYSDRSHVWIAKGYGLIQWEDVDALGAALPNTRDQLTKILVAAK